MRFLRSSRDALSREVPGRQLAAALAGLVLGLGAEWMARSKQSPLTAGVDLAVGWTLIACGLIAWTRRPKSRVGPLIAITGFAWFLGTFADSDVEALATVGVALATVYLGPLFHAIIGYPSGRLSGWLTLVVVAASYIYAATAQLARGNVVMVSVVPIVVALIVLGTTIRGYLVAAGADRQARMTAIVAAAAVSLPLAGGSVGRLVSAGPDAERVVLGGLEAALVLVAVVFLVDLVRAPWAQAAVTELVVDLGEDSETATLRGRLARAAGDRSLSIAYWLSDANSYVDERGDPVVLPAAGSGKAVTLIEQHGERIAALVHDATVLDDPALIDAVASAARIAFSNVRLRAEVRGHVVALDASRRRILETTDSQRRRLQQELRRGVGQRLAEVEALLDLAVWQASQPVNGTARASVEEAEREFHQAQAELQALAAGIHPALLTEEGLRPALSALAERAPVPVRLVLLPNRLPAAIETAVYFVCAEALTNVGKYARASRVDVELRAEGDLVTVLIADDGIGGANPSAGSGLQGIADRIEALGGRLVVESRAGAGTRLLATLPIDAPPMVEAPPT